MMPLDAREVFEAIESCNPRCKNWSTEVENFSQTGETSISQVVNNPKIWAIYLKEKQKRKSIKRKKYEQINRHMGIMRV